MWKLIILVNLIVVVNYVQCFALPFEGLYRLDIVHYNDFHARFQETSVQTATCTTNDNLCLGGFPRLYYEINKLLKEKPDAVLLNAGDSFQGTYWYTLLKWNITQKFMNMLPHDAHAIGNHEFDDGPEGLAPYLRALTAPVLAANMDTSNEPMMEGLYKPSIVIKRKGRRIGIIGLITTETEKLSSPGGVVFTDPYEATRKEANRLTEDGVDIIILLSHCGLDVDKILARDYGENIDIIVGGHTHSLLWNGVSPTGETVAGPYPVIIQPTANKGHKVLIVQASSFTKFMGDLSVYFDFRGDYVKWEGGPIFLNRTIPEDKEIKLKLEPYAKLVQEAENVPIGYSDVTLNYEDCVFGECALGNVLVDSMNEYAKELKKSPLDHISFMQRGNIKSSIPSGVIRQGTIFDLLPYNDRVETFELQGIYVLEALERSVIDAWDIIPFKGPWVLQVSGLQVTYNISKPEGERIVSATVGDDERKIDPEQTYQLTLPTYLADGGDGFKMFPEGKKNVQMIGRDEALVIEYIKKHNPLKTTTEGRIKIQY